MKAFILAGGFGTRIKPLVYSLPKPMLPIVGKPILEHLVELLKRNGFEELVFLLYFQPEEIMKYFGNGDRWKVKIHYEIPQADYGTAGALKFAERWVEEDEDFLVISGDLLTDVSLSDFFKKHKEKGANVSVGLAAVKNPLPFGIVITDREDRILKFQEKPRWSEVFSDRINAGIYAIRSEILRLIPSNQPYDFSQDLFPFLLAHRHPMYGFILDGYWRDMGDPSAYLEANMDALLGRVKIDFPGEMKEIGGAKVWMGEDVEIERARMNGTLVFLNGVRMEDGVYLEDSVIGSDSEIGEGSRIVNSVIWNNVKVGRNVNMVGSICGSRVYLGNAATLEKGTVVAEGVKIGEKARVLEGVRIWPGKEIDPETVVSSNLIWGERWKRALFEEGTIRGMTNVELTVEFMAKIGACFGTMHPMGINILTGRDTIRATRMLKRALDAGILASGVNIRDLSATPLPVIRYRLQKDSEEGGIYLRTHPEHPDITEIVFFDREGIEVSPTFEKAFERLFQREEFRREMGQRTGEIVGLPGAHNLYKEGFLKALDNSLLKERRFRLVVDFSHGPASELLPGLLSSLGCEVISLNAYPMENWEGIKVKKALDVLSRIVEATRADAGFWLDPSGERAVAVDENGKSYSEMEMLLLTLHLFLMLPKRGSISIPLFVPSYVDSAAENAGVTLRRTKANKRDTLETVREKGVFAGLYPGGYAAIPEFQKGFDGMFLIAKILETLAWGGLTLSEIGEEIPEFYFEHILISCPWEGKGKVMRLASQESVSKSISLLDGVTIFEEGGKVLLLPDHYQPYIHLFVDADERERLYSLRDEYRDKLREWIKTK